jgi:hypothetical protein
MRYTKANIERLRKGYPTATHFVHMTLKAKKGESKKEVTFTVESDTDVLTAIEANIKNLMDEHGYMQSQIKTKTYELREAKR